MLCLFVIVPISMNSPCFIPSRLLRGALFHSISGDKSILPYYFQNRNAASLLLNGTLKAFLEMTTGGRVWQIHLSGKLNSLHYPRVNCITHFFCDLWNRFFHKCSILNVPCLVFYIILT